MDKVKIKIEFEIDKKKYKQYQYALEDFCVALYATGAQANEIVIYEE